MRAGIGTVEDLRVLLTSLGVDPASVFVLNISGMNQFHLCRKRWHYARNLRRVRPQETAHFLDAGTLGHDAVQDLHQLMGEWEPDAAVGIAHTRAEELRTAVREAGKSMSESGQEKRLWFADWLTHALPHYAQKYRGVPWEKVWLVEEPMWLLLDRKDMPWYGDWGPSDFLAQTEYDHVLLVGRPDAIVQIRGKIWHCQRKFFSEQVDLLKFVKRGPFMKHEVGYLKMIEQLSAQGEFDGLPVGHTMFDLLRKLSVPQHPSTIERPVGCKKCNVLALLADRPPEEDIYQTILANHPNADDAWTREHIGKASDMLSRHHKRLDAAQLAWDHWVDRAFLRHDAIISRKQRARVWDEMLVDIGQMMAIAEGRMPATSSEGWACNAYFTECPYVGVCAGREQLTGPQFADREDDYTDLPVGEE